jgi:hypothetical protein
MPRKENPLSELEAAVDRAKTHDEADASRAALEEARRSTIGPPMIAIGPDGESDAWPPGRIVLGGRDHGKDAVELRARHIERGAMIEAHQTLVRLRIVAGEFLARWEPDETAPLGLVVTDLREGIAFAQDALAELEELDVEEAAVTMAFAARSLYGVAKAALGPLPGEAEAAKDALRSVSVQARRAVARLRMALAMRNLTHEEAQMLHETTALDAAAMLQAHASEGVCFAYGEGVWSVHGVPGTVIHADEFGSALALALTRLRRS